MSESSRAIVYIDGFNLYGSALSGSDDKWLDLVALSETLLPAGATLEVVKYFTADLLAHVAEDPDTRERQKNYVRALQATGVDVRRGTFMQNTEFRSVSEDESWSTRVKPALPSAIADQLDAMEAGATRPWKVRVRLPEEKFSDVALGVELVDDFHNDRCDLAVLVTNDSDLTPAIEKVVDQGHVVGVFSPATTLNRHLNKVATWGRPMRRSIFAVHQLPDTVWRDGTGTKFERPNVWKARK